MIVFAWEHCPMHIDHCKEIHKSSTDSQKYMLPILTTYSSISKNQSGHTHENVLITIIRKKGYHVFRISKTMLHISIINCMPMISVDIHSDTKLTKNIPPALVRSIMHYSRRMVVTLYYCLQKFA